MRALTGRRSLQSARVEGLPRRRARLRDHAVMFTIQMAKAHGVAALCEHPTPVHLDREAPHTRDGAGTGSGASAAIPPA